MYGKLYIPVGEGKHPAVILSHGYNGTNNDFINECKYYAQNGYSAYAFDLCGGSGGSKSTGKTMDMTVFTEKSDLLAVFDSFETMQNVDTDQIFLFGGSQGGLVTALAAEERAEKISSCRAGDNEGRRTWIFIGRSKYSKGKGAGIFAEAHRQ